MVRGEARSRPGWAGEWDPHPLCWLGGILRNRYGHHPGFRHTETDGLALSIARTTDSGERSSGADQLDVVLDHRPAHANGVHDVRTLDGDQVFGCLVWIDLARLTRRADQSALVLGNGTALRIEGVHGRTHVLRSPDGYVVHASRKVADLPALAQIARMLDWAAREPMRALDDDPNYWRHDHEAPFAVLLGVLDELRHADTAADLFRQLTHAPQRTNGVSDRIRQFKPQLRQALRNPTLVPEKAVRQATGPALESGGSAVTDASDSTRSDPHRLFVELWQRLYPDEALPV